MGDGFNKLSEETGSLNGHWKKFMAEAVRAQAQAVAVRSGGEGFKDSWVRLGGIRGEQSKRNVRDGGNKRSRPSDLQFLPTAGQRGPKAKQYTSESNTNETDTVRKPVAFRLY